MRVVVALPGLVTKSEMNARDHWTVRRRRFRAQADEVLLNLHRLKGKTADALRAAPRVELRLVRIAKRRLDRDNLSSAFKAVLDAVCLFLEIDDGDEERLGITWAQESGPVGIRIEMEIPDPV